MPKTMVMGEGMAVGASSSEGAAHGRWVWVYRARENTEPQPDAPAHVTAAADDAYSRPRRWVLSSATTDL